MKKLLPLVALLVTAALSVPAVAADTTAAPAKKEAHKTKHHHKGAAKAAHKGKHHGKHHGGKHHAGHAAHSEGNSMHQNNHMMVQQQRPVAPAAPEKVWLPSMRHGFQK